MADSLVNKGKAYKDEDGVVVYPFFVDLQRSLVRFARVGSSREQELSIDEFMGRYSLVQEKQAKPTASKSTAPKEK